MCSEDLPSFQPPLCGCHLLGEPHLFVEVHGDTGRTARKQFSKKAACCRQRTAITRDHGLVKIEWRVDARTNPLPAGLLADSARFRFVRFRGEVPL